MKNANRKGFTLIELLIVIAIIGILAAVLIPNLLGARARANDTAAQSCANAIATGQEIRVIDDEDYLVIPAGTVGAGGIADLTGTNTCNGVTVAAGATATGRTDYSATVSHPNGTAGVTFTVTPNGITRN